MMVAAAPPGASSPILTVLPEPGADWDAFVARHPEASIYMRSGWSMLAREVFRHQIMFIEARDASRQLVGVLPVVRQRGLVGDFATSIPFFNYGGALSDTVEIAVKLMDHARAYVQKLGCSYLELRDVHARPGDWQVRTDKVSMILDLPATDEALAKQLGSKLRSQIKRADRESVGVRKGREELLDAFYAVFAQNMRDLGTPVYPKKFFRTILARFPDNTLLLVVDHQDRPAAAGFLVFDKQRAEIPWAACRSEAKPLGMNMKLYWEALSTSIQRGCTSFDFGRSTSDSGTFKFKKQWGAQPLQLHWHRWERKPSVAAVSGNGFEGRLMQYASAVWQRLPVPIANFLGPLVSPSLPW
jgi:serine/alanine adding enzyme